MPFTYSPQGETVELTTPDELGSPNIFQALRAFESGLIGRPKGRDFYQVSMIGILDAVTCHKIVEAYKAAGWSKASCNPTGDTTLLNLHR